MNLNRYEIFLKTAEIGNITKTAEILHYTQAGISHAISALEKETGVTLLVRSVGGVTLTESAKQLLPHIQSLVNEQKKLSQAIYGINHVLTGTLRLGTFSSVSAQWVPGLIREFQALYPDVGFELLSGDYDSIIEDIHSGRSDCGFLTEYNRGDFSFTPLYRDPMMAVLPASHPLAGRSAIGLDDLKEDLLLLPSGGCNIDILEAIKDCGLRSNPNYRFSDDFSILAMVASGFGVTILPDLVLHNFNFNVKILPLHPAKTRTIGIASLPPERLSLLARTFLSFLKERRF